MSRLEFQNRASKLFQSYFNTLGIRQEANREAADMIDLDKHSNGRRFGMTALQ